MIPSKLRFTSALPCVDCEQSTQQGLIYAKSSLARQRAHNKAQRALRIGLNRAYRRQMQVMEVGLL